MWNVTNSNNPKTQCPYCKWEGEFTIVEEHLSSNGNVSYFFLRCGNPKCHKFLSSVHDPDTSSDMKDFKEWMKRNK